MKFQEYTTRTLQLCKPIAPQFQLTYTLTDALAACSRSSFLVSFFLRSIESGKTTNAVNLVYLVGRLRAITDRVNALVSNVSWIGDVDTAIDDWVLNGAQAADYINLMKEQTDNYPNYTDFIENGSESLARKHAIRSKFCLLCAISADSKVDRSLLPMIPLYVARAKSANGDATVEGELQVQMAVFSSITPQDIETYGLTFNVDPV